MTSLAALTRAATASLLLAASPAATALCSGFTDVDQAHPMCPNVDWLRNRAVTLGCSSTLFCPNDAVSRLAMAAFMNRLGNALTPSVATVNDSGSALPLSSPAIVCAIEVPPVAFPRSANVIGVVSAQIAAAAGTSMHVVVATNNLANWASMTQAPPALAGASGWINGAVQGSALPLDAGTRYHFAIRLDPLPGTAPFGPWSCEIKSQVASRTGAGAPY